ncbi:hypothetical protein C8Q77DRAFT_1101616 [Trametes polyzona]|nr:hypothetical protein C8Q77DRAFT_1101616 [Trametes polyzona]
MLRSLCKILRLPGYDCISYLTVAVLHSVLDALHSIAAIHLNYCNLVKNYFRPDRLIFPPWSLRLEPLLTGVTLIACQIFFARRVYLVNNRYWPLVVIAGVMFLAEFGFATAFTAKAFMLDDIQLLNNYAWMESSGFGVIIAADVVLTSVLVYSLHRKRTGFKHTNSKIDLLIAYAIGTGLATLIFAVACFITAIASSGNLLFGALDTICVKVYINSVLATLNARPSPMSEREAPSAESIDLAVIQCRSPRRDAVKDWSVNSVDTSNVGPGRSVINIERPVIDIGIRVVDDSLEVKL